LKSADEKEKKMWLKTAVNLLDKILKPLSLGLYAIGGVALMVMMVLTAADVALRNTLNIPVIGTFDLTEYMMAIAVAFGLSYCALKKGHISADALISKLSRRPRMVFDTFATLVSMCVTGAISWQLFINMQKTHILGLQSNILHIPVSPFLGMVAIGFTLFTLVLLKDLFEILSQEVAK
jgi:TRAP-type transport system small permease protein